MSRPWMPLYVADYLGDTRRLTTLQHGAYMLLIMEYWVSGSLPTDDPGLAQIAGLSEREWLKIKPAIEAKFLPGWKHKRVDDELAKAEAKSAAARENGSRGARNKWGGADAARQKRSERLAAAREKGRHTADEWKAMLRAFPTCLACGADEHIVKDHITPIYQGGSDSIENIQPLCHSCNSGKGPDTSDLRPADWRDKVAAGMPSERLANASHRAGVPQPQPQELSSSLRSEERSLRTRNLAAELVSCLPIGTGWKISTTIVPPAGIAALIKDGCDVDRHILPAVRQAAQRAHKAGKQVGSWAFFEASIRDARDADKSLASAPTTVQKRPAYEAYSDENWIALLDRVRRNGEPWPSYAGPAPGDPKCAVPGHLLAKINSERAA